MTASRGLLGHTLDINECHHGFPAQKLLVLPQNSVKILNWKHKTGLTSGCRAQAACHSLRPCSQASLFFRNASQSGYLRIRCHFAMYTKCVASQLFRAAGANWSHGNEHCCKRNQTAQRSGCWLFNSDDFSPCGGCHWGGAGMSARSWDTFQLLQRSHGLSS